MDITEIKSFLAVIEYRSFTLAAKRAHITQSAMNKRMQKIENELGMRLFIVDGSKITLTDAANHFIPYARQMLAAYNDTVMSFKNEAQAFQHHLVIGASVFVSHYILPKFLNYLKTVNSPVQLHIKTIGENDIEERLNYGTVDLVICPERELSAKLFTKIQLWEEKYYLVVDANHELLQINEQPTLADLAHFPAIFTERGTAVREKVETLFQENQLNLNLGLEINTMDAIKALVEYGLGWSILPNKLISKQLKILNSDAINVLIPFNAYFLKKRAEDRGINNLLHFFDKWQYPNPKEEKILWK
ncbi:LysR family transcriptional regulator [Legionella anisa]|uniref:LysR family transcriptional regulator n=1 Tax=Legionella anisa TaxID=28082 RepID=A0AAX0WZ75_9GAMM|nr:LysR family transcriptional regulator [Legionella anisa]AWN72923.1 LysR family transcriptional regulator [Legionella anisa]KTC70623.1 LysR family transcriptional regulator [Legionella anisa]MBN5937194.1 LysR family transcriptional regulator [Legionella anisa]MCW8423734.1 LysR family transcriptional regulator [Legionella anisa]MCW8447254.1 LysR family transcriptional regulator [Legionella anisa]